MFQDPAQFEKILSSPQGDAVMQGMEKVIRMLNSSGGRELMRQLSTGGAEVLASVCGEAKDADNAAKALINGLLRSEAGTRLISGVLSMAGGKEPGRG